MDESSMTIGGNVTPGGVGGGGASPAESSRGVGAVGGQGEGEEGESDEEKPLANLAAAAEGDNSNITIPLGENSGDEVSVHSHHFNEEMLNLIGFEGGRDK